MSDIDISSNIVIDVITDIKVISDISKDIVPIIKSNNCLCSIFSKKVETVETVEKVVEAVKPQNIAERVSCDSSKNPVLI
jgi:thioredoxin-related protein